MRNVLTKVLYISALCFVISQTTLAQQQKYALVIGAQNYTSLPPLRNSLSDARDLTISLRAKGFKVETLIDPKTKREIKDAIIRYQTAMQNAVGGVGIIFYAGHGMQFEGNNYIIPTTAKLELSSDLDDQCLKMNAVMAVLNSTNKSLNILFLDACRSIPSFNRDSEQGWTKVNAPRGSIIVFATEAGKVASDGNEKNGLFTSKLLTRINEPGLNITDVLKRVKQDVFIASDEKQLPSLEDNSIGGDFFFTPGTNTTTQPITQTIVKTEPVYIPPVKTEAIIEEVKETLASALVYSHPSIDFGYGPSKTSAVKIGNQEWITQNLNVDHFANGDIIPEAKTEKEWKRAGEKKQPAWCYYNNDPANGSTYGRLYNGYAVNDPRGLAPPGWHVPSDTEWTATTNYLGGETTAGLKMKSTSGWNENGNGNNNSGIAGLPGGVRLPNGSFNALGKYGGCWSSSGNYATAAWYRVLNYNNGEVSRNYTSTSCGIYVRCLRD